MTPFTVTLFYNRNEYLRILDFLEGDTDIPDDLLNAFIDGIREQVDTVGFDEPIHIGAVVMTRNQGPLVRWTAFSKDGPWVDAVLGKHYHWDQFSDSVVEIVK